MKSIHQATNGNLKQELATIANRYMAMNPIENVTYRITNRQGFMRNSKFRYELDFLEKISDLKLGEKVRAWGKIVTDGKTDFHFFVQPYSPTKIYINNELVYKSDITSENARFSKQFSYDTDEKELSVIVESKRTKIGCGCEFGSAQIKSYPIYVLAPTLERKNQEGWVYKKVSDMDEFNDWLMDTSEQQKDFLPKNHWTEEDKEKSLFERLNISKGEVVIASFKADCFTSGDYQFKSNVKTAQLLYKNKECVTDEKINLTTGQHTFFVKLKNTGQKIYDLQIRFIGEEGEVRFQSAFSPDFPTFSYLGPLKFSKVSYQVLSDCSRIIEDQYWRLDAPGQHIRLFLETELFGKWNYPLGVTLRGLIDYGVVFEKKDVLDYVKAHIECCTKHYHYALWDTKHYGAPAINNNIALMDSLDDCGSFARTVLEALKFFEVAESVNVLNDIAEYIVHKQSKFEARALYRKHAHVPLMGNTLWIDDMYMSVPFLIEYSKFINDERYFNEAKEQMKAYYDYLWLEKKNLFGHVYNFNWDTCTDVVWGRGNGWYLFSITDLLNNMTEDDPDRTFFIDVYNRFVKGLFDVIGPNDMWHQLLDDHGSYEETSCTLINMYALLEGMEHSWIKDKEFEKCMLPHLFKSWQYVTETKIDYLGNLYGVCRGSGYSFDPDYYKYDLLPRTNDTHGIGITFMAGCKIHAFRNEVIESNHSSL